jgi:hypothetical protein
MVHTLCLEQFYSCTHKSSLCTSLCTHVLESPLCTPRDAWHTLCLEQLCCCTGPRYSSLCLLVQYVQLCVLHSKATWRQPGLIFVNETSQGFTTGRTPKAGYRGGGVPPPKNCSLTILLRVCAICMSNILNLIIALVYMENSFELMYLKEILGLMFYYNTFFQIEDLCLGFPSFFLLKTIPWSASFLCTDPTCMAYFTLFRLTFPQNIQVRVVFPFPYFKQRSSL